MFFLLKPLKLGEIDGVNFLTNSMSATIFYQAEKKEFCEGEKPHVKSDNEEETTKLNLNIALGT